MVEQLLGGGRRVDASRATLIRLGLVHEITETQFNSLTTGTRAQVADVVSRGFQRTDFGNFFVAAVTRPKPVTEADADADHPSDPSPHAGE